MPTLKLVLICAQLCHQVFENQERFRNSGGVESLQAHLCFEPSDAVRQDNLVVAVIDCIWLCIIGNVTSESSLIQLEGVDRLLDLLEM
jgi:hypothetical protein